MKELHPICIILPQAAPPDLGRLTQNIKANGLLEKIVLYEGKILDGRNRYLASQQAGVELTAYNFQDFEDIRETMAPDSPLRDPISYVMAENLNRRNLTKGQIAQYIVEFEKFRKIGRPKKGVPGTGIRSNSQVAKDNDISEATIHRAKRIDKLGNKKVAAAVKEGTISQKDGEKIAKFPKPKQERLAAQGPAAMKASVAPSRPPPRGGLAAEAREANREAEALSNGSVEETHEVLEALDACWEEHKPQWSYPPAAPHVVYKALRAAAEAALLRPEAR